MLALLIFATRLRSALSIRNLWMRALSSGVEDGPVSKVMQQPSMTPILTLSLGRCVGTQV
jgi:hypothetical protein